MDFELVSLVAKDLPKAYQIPRQDMGFLILPGKERLIALDDQHRLLSLRIAIKGVYGVPDDIYAVIVRKLFSDGEVLAPIGKCELVN